MREMTYYVPECYHVFNRICFQNRVLIDWKINQQIIGTVKMIFQLTLKQDTQGRFFKRSLFYNVYHNDLLDGGQPRAKPIYVKRNQITL